jgi:hypothetical protein
MNIDAAANNILESSCGIHALVVYSESAVLREFWSYYTKKSIEEKDELVCLAPFYETVYSMKKTLSEGYMLIDTQKFEVEEKSLIIMDSLQKYFGGHGRVLPIELILNANQELIQKSDKLNKNGVSILGDLGSFHSENQQKSLEGYELSLPIDFGTNLKGICFYHQKDFDRLSADQKEKIKTA